MSKWENLYSSLLNEINTKDWFSHVEEIGGNASICFVSVGGTQNNDFVLSGTLEPTPLVKHYPSIQKICFALNQPIARVRLMRLAAKTKIYQHQSYYQYFCYHPVFIPLQTNDALYFYQKNNESIKLQQGELFSFEPCSGQALENKSDEAIIQLVIEYKNAPKVSLAFLETHSNTQNWQQCITSAPYFKVFLPIELQQLNHAFLNSVQKLTLNNEKLSQLQQHIAVFNQQWQTTYNQYGDNSKGELAYWNHILQFKETIFPLIRFQYKQLDAVGRSIFEIITSLLFTAPSTPKRLNRHLLNTQSRKRKTTASTIKIEANFIRPVFIVSAPRAGSTLLFNCLSQLADLWTTGEENHELLENIKGLHPADKNYHSNRLLAEDASIEIAIKLRQCFSQRLVDNKGRVYKELSEQERPLNIHFLEKTPKNALRIPFLKTLFPDATFIYLHREPYANINSLMEGWRSRRFIAYKDLPQWSFKDWSFLLTPDWELLTGCSLVEITAYQWKIANQTIINDLKTLSPSDWTMLSYEQLIANPQKKLQQLLEFMQINGEATVLERIATNLPITPVTLSSPQTGKWKKHAQELDKISGIVQTVVEMIDVMAVKR